MLTRHDIGSEVAEFRRRASPLIAGMWRLSENLDKVGTREYIAACLEGGINTFDHADIYGSGESERRFGSALRELAVPRDKVVIISKCGNIMPGRSGGRFDVKRYDTSRAHIVKSVEGMLGRLDTDYLDMLMVHRYDPLADYPGIASAFQELKVTGKVRSFGVSNFTPLQFDYLNEHLGGLLLANQVECSVFHPAPMMDSTFDCLQARALVPMAWGPLGGNLPLRLAGNPGLQAVLVEAGKMLGIGESLGTVALCWLLAHPARIVPVIGTTKIARLHESLRAISITMPKECFFAILATALRHELP